MPFEKAILRRPGADAAKGLTTANLGAPDFQRLVEQHSAYRQTLEDLELECLVLDALPGSPDAWFVEDTAVLTKDLAVITRPGAPSRRGETTSIAQVLAGMKPVARIEAPGTLDGGDVLLAGGHCYVGLSDRTNEAGAGQLAAHFRRVGIATNPVRVPSGLHLKSGVNYLRNGQMLMTREFATEPAFAGFDRLILATEENYAANTLWINGTLLVPAGYPRITARLESLGYPVITLDMSETAKMDGGLSCLSLRF